MGVALAWSDSYPDREFTSPPHDEDVVPIGLTSHNVKWNTQGNPDARSLIVAYKTFSLNLFPARGCASPCAACALAFTYSQAPEGSDSVTTMIMVLLELLCYCTHSCRIMFHRLFPAIEQNYLLVEKSVHS